MTEKDRAAKSNLNLALLAFPRIDEAETPTSDCPFAFLLKRLNFLNLRRKHVFWEHSKKTHTNRKLNDETSNKEAE